MSEIAEKRAALDEAEELAIWRSIGESLSGPEGRLPEIHEKALQDLGYTNMAEQAAHISRLEEALAGAAAALDRIAAGIAEEDKLVHLGTEDECAEFCGACLYEMAIELAQQEGEAARLLLPRSQEEVSDG